MRKSNSVSAGRWGMQFVWLGLSMAVTAPSAMGQVLVGLDLEHRTIMESEPAVIKVVVQNDAATPLVFNEIYNNAELRLSIHRVRGGGEPIYKMLKRNFVIMPGDRNIELVEMTSCWDIKMPATYQVRAQVRHEGQVYTSRPQAFDVVHGIELKRINRPLEGAPGSMLTYSLRYCTREGMEFVFVVVTDDERDMSYGTFKLGPIVRASAPAMRFDNQGRLLVAHQSGRYRFTRSVIVAHEDGAVFAEQTHHNVDDSDSK